MTGEGGDIVTFDNVGLALWDDAGGLHDGDDGDDD